MRDSIHTVHYENWLEEALILISRTVGERSNMVFPKWPENHEDTLPPFASLVIAGIGSKSGEQSELERRPKRKLKISYISAEDRDKEKTKEFLSVRLDWYSMWEKMPIEEKIELLAGVIEEMLLKQKGKD